MIETWELECGNIFQVTKPTSSHEIFAVQRIADGHRCHTVEPDLFERCVVQAFYVILFASKPRVFTEAHQTLPLSTTVNI